MLVACRALPMAAQSPPLRRESGGKSNYDAHCIYIYIYIFIHIPIYFKLMIGLGLN